jgi:hypothetical protein
MMRPVKKGHFMAERHPGGIQTAFMLSLSVTIALLVGWSAAALAGI